MRKVISATRDNESINIKTIFLQHESFHPVVFPVDLYRLFRSIQRISITGTIQIYIYIFVEEDQKFLPYFETLHPGIRDEFQSKEEGRGEISFTINLPIYFAETF